MSSWGLISCVKIQLPLESGICIKEEGLPEDGGEPFRSFASETPNTNIVYLVFRWTICARVTNKSQIRTWSNSRGEGKLFSIELVDESVSICRMGKRI